TVTETTEDIITSEEAFEELNISVADEMTEVTTGKPSEAEVTEESATETAEASEEATETEETTEQPADEKTTSSGLTEGTTAEATEAVQETETTEEAASEETIGEAESPEIGTEAGGTPTDAAEGSLLSMISLFMCDVSDMPMLLAAGASANYGFRLSATGDDYITATCLNGDHPAKAVITSQTHNGKYIHCADSSNTSAFQWTNSAWHSGSRYWTLTEVDNGMADILFSYYAGADPNGAGNQKSDAAYLQLTKDLTPKRDSASSARTVPHASAFVVKNGTEKVKDTTVEASLKDGVQETPTLTFSTGTDVICHSVSVPKDVTIHYRGKTETGWKSVTGEDDTEVIIADGGEAYFSVPSGSSITKASVSTRSVRLDGSDYSTGYYIGKQYILEPEFTVTNNAGDTVTLQKFMFCDGETAASSFDLRFTSYGSVYLEKTSADPSFTDGCGIYTTKGIEYTVYFDAARTVPADAFKMDKDGSFSKTDPKFVIGDDNESNVLYFPLGVKYYYKETKTNDYFALDTSPASKQNFTLADAHAVPADVHIRPANALKLSEADVPVSDPVGLQLLKTDSEGITVANTTGENPDAFTGPDLTGAVFRMDYYSDYYDTVNRDGSITGAVPDSTWYFQTNVQRDGTYSFTYNATYLAPGYASSPIKINSDGFAALPLGTVVMYEADPPKGYNKSGAMLDAAGTVNNQVFIGQVRPANINGIQSARTFVKGAGDNAFETNQSGKRVRVFTTAQSGTPVALAEDAVRVGFTVSKMDYVTYGEMEDVFFKITSSTGESHYIKTGDKGFYSSEAVPHTKYTNAYDRLFDDDPSNDTIDGVNIAELDCGLWFYGTADETEWTADKIDDTKKACRYDESLVFTEIVTDANEGKQMIVDCTVSLTVNDTIRNLGVWTNVPDIQLSSLESDASTGTHASVPEKGTVIKDLVTYRYLTAGKTYTLKGILMEKREDGSVAPLKDAEGNLIRSNEVFTVDGSFIKTAQEKCGDVTVTFSFDGSALDGKTFVVYEYLFDGNSMGLIETDGDAVITDGAKLNTAGEVISHADSGDEDQTGSFYSIKTYASGTSGTNLTEISKNMEITDSVSCTGLDAGYEYRLDGALKYKDQNGQIKDVLDGEGNPLTFSKHFICENGNDVIEMKFPAFDGTQLLGSDGKPVTGGIVVYEKLYWNNTLLVSHEDIDDKDQTVFIPEIKTTALSENGTKTVYAKKDVAVTDHVSYKNLVVGKKYTLKGILTDKATGRPLLDGNGSEITAETTFTAETADGSVDVTFKFDAVALSGKTAVVFESLYHNGTEIAVHADIEDEDQTFYIPGITTTARDAATGSNEGRVSEKVTIIDTVSYKNLIVGKEYTIKGILMDKATGEPFITADGEQVTAEKTFTAETADGFIELEFTFNGSELEGKSVVVFERIYHEGIEVGSHADLEDEGQTIHFPPSEPPSGPPHTGDSVPVAAVIVIMLLALAGIIVTAVARSRKKD
ncbi:MAG: VaFE repeat-containing surface-anchored protein, partial [Clostridium sp.]|nr:VaFE repeat-containing surface-anchored protein [Clostridium sp.]